MSAPTIGSGESTTYDQTVINTGLFGEAAAIHTDEITSAIANAQAIAAANRQLADDLQGLDMDAAAEAAVAADAAEAYAAKLAEVQGTLDTWGGAVAALKEKVGTHAGAADAIKALGGGAANRTGYYED